jgi:hypothetical protein
MAATSQKRVKGILFGLVLCSLASIFWARWNAPERHRTFVAAQNTVLTTTEQPLFKSAPSVPEAMSSRSAMVASMQTLGPRFQLIGTLIAPPLTSCAIIATGKGDALFTPGAAIDGRWRLQRVFPGRILVRSAESESMVLIRSQAPVPETLDTEVIEASPSPVRVSHAEKLDRYYAGRLPETVAFPGGLQAYGIEEVRDQTFSVDMQALLDQHLQTPLWRQFDYEMDAEGMRLVEIVPGGVVDRFGFLPGDIVAKIDDIPLTRVEDLQYLLHPNSHRVRVEFRRAATAMTHTYLLQ